MALKRDIRTSQNVTRRDFIGATLLGAGAALLDAPCPARAPQSGREWTGYGGIGDYENSNGNTAEVVRAAHKIRDGAYDKGLSAVLDTGEAYDIVIVGAGFTGMAALNQFRKSKPHGTCLLIDNHPIFGGEAKQNDFEVNGYRLTGPQGSNQITLNDSDYCRELGLPSRVEYVEREGGNSSIVFANENFAAMYWNESCATVGYYFQQDMRGEKGTWIKDAWRDNLKRAPLPENVRKDLIAWRDSPKQSKYRDPQQDGAWLDSMTYADLVTKIMGFGKDVLRYVDPLINVGNFGASSDVISAYAAAHIDLPGVAHPTRNFEADNTTSFPGGNATLLRYMVKAVFPDAIAGQREFAAIANNPVNFQALDRPAAPRRMRLSATAIRVSHDGVPERADHVNLVYEKSGRLYRVKAKTAVLAIGSWVAKHIVTDLPEDYRIAFNNFYHGPILVVNVALTNWRFLDRLGISAAHWFDGFGFFANVRQPMVAGNNPAPFHPDKPIVMTFYVPFVNPGMAIGAQGAAGRTALFGTSYADYERQILTQMQKMFGSGGFDASRDVAGIVLNRWGHAYVSPQPGFYFGVNGHPAPRDIIRQRFGRIAFGHSELNGAQNFEAAITEGERAGKQAIDLL
jgi:spermidine dehydrogenase